MRAIYDVLVIGAGQAGLACAYFLRRAGVSYLVVDAHPAIGDSWRNRYASLKLFTPRSMSGLPGTPLPGDPDGYATKDEFADYLTRYADGLQVATGTRVAKLRKQGQWFAGTTDDGRLFSSSAVIVASGAFQKPRIPALAAHFPADVRQLHVADFQDTSSVADGPVLVIGDGASGRDVAISLAGSHFGTLSHGRRRKLFPERILGRSTWWWLQRLGLLRARADSLIGRRMRAIDPFPDRGNDDRSMKRLVIVLEPRLEAVEGRAAIFADGTRLMPGTVVWATGYSDEISWMEIDGVSFAVFTQPDDLEADLKLFRKVLAGQRDGYTIEKRYLRRDSSIVHVVIHVAAMSARRHSINAISVLADRLMISHSLSLFVAPDCRCKMPDVTSG
ncbi:FAD-dependent oxidoreductase [Neorhizobium sp. NPDC001467]|uniref:flavin-containing monooxygenase n=1 Tax=Neorhizobium sp. NPDC001467 TaxID=3390595 RepID=UPI003D0127F3